MLNPGIGLILALAFLLLWLNRREQTYVAVAAASYTAAAVGFLIQDVGPILPYELQRIPANLGFLAAGYLLAVSVLGRYGIKAPHRVLLTVSAMGTAGLCWFLLVDPSITYRVYSISFALGAISLIMWVRLRRIDRPRLMDRALTVLTLLTGLNFILRPVAIFALIGEVTSYNSPQQAFYWSTVQFTQAIISVVFALNLLLAVATDLIDELKHQAHTDKLSGLLNRRGFEECAAAAMKEAAAKGRPVALLIADLDHFKAINDTYGHAVGDTVISMFGAMLARAAGDGMVTGRIGGEEFAVLIPGAEVNMARLFGERLRAEIAVNAAGALPHGLEPTVSVGIHVASGDVELYRLMSHADLALYEAKRTGRDRVCVFEGGMTRTAEPTARRHGGR